MVQLLEPDRSTICLYHNDPDGCGAAAVVRRWLGPALILQPMEIGDPVPWEAVERCEQVVMADYSLGAQEMRRLRQGRRLVWVDHHKTSLAELAESMADVPGERQIGVAACVLTWRTFFPEQPVPRAIELIGDRDVWRMEFPETRAFSEGLYQHDLDPANDELWVPLLDGDPQRLAELTARGRVLYEARMAGIADTVARYGFETVFEGHRTLAVNHRGSGDMGEHIRQRGYALAYCYAEAVRAGKLLTVVTLYSDQVDVSDIARKYGGGGHRGAAGFQLERAGRPFPPGSERSPGAA